MIRETVSRREFLRWSAAAGALAAAGSVGCRPHDQPAFTMERATLHSRPALFSGTAPRGMTTINVWSKADAFLYVPPTYQDNQPAPFILLLHGSGGHATSFSPSFLSHVDDKGVVVLAIDAVAPTWDLIAAGGYGPDIEHIDAALGWAFKNCNVDPARTAIGGFSDGATYALCAGVPNGDLFKAIVAFSPATIDAPGERGKPRVFLSHGTGDGVIPFSNSTGWTVPELRRRGYDVTFREFTGGHTVPPEVADEAFIWLRDLV
jgi:phospholipase/carboxylesterase